jgi:hypothetical protein
MSTLTVYAACTGVDPASRATLYHPPRFPEEGTREISAGGLLFDKVLQPVPRNDCVKYLLLPPATVVCLLHPLDVFLIKRTIRGNLDMGTDLLQHTVPPQLKSHVPFGGLQVHVVALVDIVLLFQVGSTCSASECTRCSSNTGNVLLITIRHVKVVTIIVLYRGGEGLPLPPASNIGAP